MVKSPMQTRNAEEIRAIDMIVTVSRRRPLPRPPRLLHLQIAAVQVTKVQ